MRKKIEPTLKAKDAIEAIKGEKTVAEFASQFGVHPNQVSQSRKKVMEALPDLFATRRKKGDRESEELQSELRPVLESPFNIELMGTVGWTMGARPFNRVTVTLLWQ